MIDRFESFYSLLFSRGEQFSFLFFIWFSSARERLCLTVSSVSTPHLHGVPCVDNQADWMNSSCLSPTWPLTSSQSLASLVFIHHFQKNEITKCSPSRILLDLTVPRVTSILFTSTLGSSMARSQLSPGWLPFLLGATPAVFSASPGLWVSQSVFLDIWIIIVQIST